MALASLAYVFLVTSATAAQAAAERQTAAPPRQGALACTLYLSTHRLSVFPPLTTVDGLTHARPTKN